jgi:succinate dehydrogenase / fumarate reductase membrane anchor subunit
MKVLTFTVIVSLLVHVWVGMRDILMDYVKSVGARLELQVFVIVWLVGCAGWAIQCTSRTSRHAPTSSSSGWRST